MGKIPFPSFQAESPCIFSQMNCMPYLAATSPGEDKNLKALEQRHESLGTENIQGKGFVAPDDPKSQLYSFLAGVLGKVSPLPSFTISSTSCCESLLEVLASVFWHTSAV